jgi:uncharacterized protein (DUF1501 family)
MTNARIHPASIRDMPMSPARRRLLLGSAAWAAGSAGAFGLGMHATAALGQASGDYKALVCIFLYGGNDHGNTVVPYGTAEYQRYVDGRGGLARDRSDLLPISAPSVTSQQLALPRELAGIKALYDQRQVAIVSNVGVLNRPVSKAQVLDGSGDLPPQIRSHSDHQDFWQSGVPSYAVANGWGGRMADIIGSANAGSPVSPLLSLSGTTRWQIGDPAFPYSLSTDGPGSMSTPADARRGPALRAILAQETSHPFEQELARIYRRSADETAALVMALAAAPNVDAYCSTTVDPRNDLKPQLAMVAKLIATRAALGHRRQIFMVGQGGYDSHSDLVSLRRLHTHLNEAVVGFSAAMAGLGVASNVTTFTASEFGRRLMTNGGGSDHGWGGHHFVMGGAVKGGDVYGTFPVIARNGPDDYYEGVLIPTTSVDQYGATLAKWMGVSNTDLPLVMPNIGRFGPTLGFI